MDLSSEILKYLFSWGEVKIPGLGRLYLRRIPAQKAFHENKIYGPGIIIQFQEDTSSDKSGLQEIIKNKFNLDKSKAKKRINKASTHLLNQLFNIGKAEISGLGYFEMQEGEGIKFFVDKNIKKLIKEVYPDIEINYIKSAQSENQADEVISPTFSATYEKEQKIGWFFPLLALVATSLLFACLVSCFFERWFDDDSNYSLNLGNKSGEITAVKLDTQNDLDDHQLLEEVIFEDSVLENEENIQEESTILQTMPDSSKDTNLNEDHEYDADISIDDSQSTVINNFEEVEQLSLDVLLQRSADKRLSYSDPCMIVVGSYLRRDLLDLMVNRLNGLGHKIYIEKYGRFYRTCIIFECSDKNRMQFLHDIRNNIEKDAWILNY